MKIVTHIPSKPKTFTEVPLDFVLKHTGIYFPKDNHKIRIVTISSNGGDRFATFYADGNGIEPFFSDIWHNDYFVPLKETMTISFKETMTISFE